MDTVKAKLQTQSLLSLLSGILCFLLVPLAVFTHFFLPPLAQALFVDSIFIGGVLTMICFCMGLDRVYRYFFHGTTPYEIRNSPKKKDVAAAAVGMTLCLSGDLSILGILMLIPM